LTPLTATDNKLRTATGPACPGCGAAMLPEFFERVPAGELEIDICYPCCAIWFDHMESAQLAPGGVIALFRKIHEHRADARHALPQRLPCPRCRQPLAMTNDIVKAGRVSYYRCAQNHGRMTTFLHFLREKRFVRDLNAGEIATIKAQLAEVRCSGCGGPVDISRETACGYCRAPLSVLDAEAVEKALKDYADKHQQRTDPARIAAALHDALVVQPARARAREQPATVFQQTDAAWSTADLVLSGISMLVRSLAK
jgi:Zn-finger nucleic acid-binding protein